MATLLKQPATGTSLWLDECIARSGGGVFSEYVVLTPALAAELLRRNPENRTLRVSKLEQLTNDIRHGRWVFNGEPIIMSSDGYLNDGQHRANAVINANQSVPVLMVFGLDRESRITLDQGSARTAGDYLAMGGTANATVQASIGRQVIAYEKNEGKSLARASFITSGEIRSRCLSDAGIGASAHFAACHRKGAKVFAAPSLVGFCHYLFSSIDRSDADKFLVQVCDGEGLRVRDPAYTVRDRLLVVGRVGMETKVHIIMRGWNAFRQGRPLAMAKVLDGGLPALI